MAKKYAILRVEKLMSKRAVTGAVMHNLRAINTPNADPGKTDQNVLVKGMETVDKCRARYNARLGDHKPRKGAVYGFEVVVTASPEQLEKMSWKEVHAYFNDAYKWAVERYGGSKNLINAVVHRDEKSPHLQMVFIPMIDDKLSYKKMLGGHRNTLSREQDAFYQSVGVRHGLDRGIKGSKARHKKIREYYRETQKLDSVKRSVMAENKKLVKLERLMDSTEKGAQNALRTLFQPIHDMMLILSENIDTKALSEARRLLDNYHAEMKRNPLGDHVPDEVKQEVDNIIRQTGWTPKP